MIFEIPFFVKSHFTAEYIIGVATKLQPFDKSKIPEIIKSFPDLASLVVFCIFPLVLGLIVLFTLNCCCCCSCGFRKRLGRQTPTCFSKVCYFATIVTSCLLLLQVAFIFILGFAGTFAGMGKSVLKNTNSVVDYVYGSADTVLQSLLGEENLFTNYMKEPEPIIYEAINSQKILTNLQLAVNQTLEAITQQIGQVLKVKLNDSQQVQFDAFMSQINDIQQIADFINSGSEKNIPSGYKTLILQGPDNFNDMTDILEPFKAENLLDFIKQILVIFEFESLKDLPLEFLYSNSTDFAAVLEYLNYQLILKFLAPEFLTTSSSVINEKLVEVKGKIQPYMAILDVGFGETVKQLIGLKDCQFGQTCDKFNIKQWLGKKGVPEFIINQLDKPERFLKICILLVCAVFALPIIARFIRFMKNTLKKNPKATKIFTHHPFKTFFCSVLQFVFTLLAFLLLIVFTAVLSVLTFDISKNYDQVTSFIPSDKKNIFELVLPDIPLINLSPKQLNVDYSSIEKLQQTLKLSIVIKTPENSLIQFEHQLVIQFNRIPPIADQGDAAYSDIFKYNSKDLIGYLKEIFQYVKQISSVISQDIGTLKLSIGLQTDGNLVDGSQLSIIENKINEIIKVISTIDFQFLENIIPVNVDLNFKLIPDYVEKLSLLFRATDPAFTLPSAVTPAQLISIYSGTIAAAAVLNGQNEAEIKANFANNDIFANLSKFAIELQNSNTIFGVTRAKLLQTLSQFTDPTSETALKQKIETTFCAQQSTNCAENVYENFKKAVNFNLNDDEADFDKRLINAAGLADYLYQAQVSLNSLKLLKSNPIELSPIVQIGFDWTDHIINEIDTVISPPLDIIESLTTSVADFILGRNALISPNLMYEIYTLLNDFTQHLRAPVNVLSLFAATAITTAISGGIFAACSRKSYGKKSVESGGEVKYEEEEFKLQNQ